MRKICGILVLIAVAGIMTQNALAQPSITFFFDDRDFDAGTQAEGGDGVTGNDIWTAGMPPWVNELPGLTGGRGYGQQLFVSPVELSGGHIYTSPNGTYNASVNELWLYMDVAEKFAGASNEVVSSVGLDMAISNTVVGHDLASISFTMLNPLSKWNQVVSGTSSLTGVVGAKAVRVPVNTGPVFDATMGYQPGGSYKIGKLQATGATMADPYIPPGTYTVKMAVNSLLITRVYNGVGYPTTPENVAFGYFNGTPEVAGSGSTVGTTSATADAVIVVKGKGDYDNNGWVDADDIGPDTSTPGYFLWNVFSDYAANVDQHWSGDFDNSGYVDADDIGDPSTGGFMFNVFNWY